MSQRALRLVAVLVGVSGCPALVEDEFSIERDPSPNGVTAVSGAGGSSTGEAGRGGASDDGSLAGSGMNSSGGADIAATGGSTVGTGGSAVGTGGSALATGGDSAAGGVAQGGKSGKADSLVCGEALPITSSECPNACARCEAGTCFIECADKDACKALRLHCPAGLACEVQCRGEVACGDATIDCTDAAACIIDCSSTDACKHARIDCGAGPCSLACSGGEAACQDTAVHCGDNRCEAECPDDSELPRMMCGDSCDCRACGD